VLASTGLPIIAEIKDTQEGEDGGSGPRTEKRHHMKTVDRIGLISTGDLTRKAEGRRREPGSGERRKARLFSRSERLALFEGGL